MTDCVSDIEFPASTRLGRSSMSAISDEFEATILDIRGSSGWIQRLVDEIRDVEEYSQQSQCAMTSPTSCYESADSQEICCLVSHIFLVDQSTEACSASRQWQSPIQPSISTLIKDGKLFHSVGLGVRPLDPSQGSKGWYKYAYTLRMAAIGVVQIAIIAFTMALQLTLKTRADSLLTWHPVLMGAVLVMLTEATLFMQHVPWTLSPGVRRLGYKAYSVVQWLGAATCAASIIACIRSYSETRRIYGLDPVHHRVGFAAILALAAQLWLDMDITVCAGTFEAALKSKNRRKWSRALGYIALLLLWISAWLGVHSKWLQNGNNNREQALAPEWMWFAIFSALIVALVGLADLSKLGLS